MNSFPSRLKAFVDRLASRSALSEEERGAILGLPITTVEIRARQDFVRVDEVVPYSCLIVAGLVARVGQTASGARQITALHIPGDMADLHSVVQSTAGSALQALSTATLLRLPNRAWRQVAARYPAIAEALWRDCRLTRPSFRSGW